MHTVSLDWITPDAQKVVAKHARVSSKNPDKKEFKRLLGYCIRHGHWSVFEQASCSVEVLTSRAISAQLMRHRSFSFQELSQRYCNPWEILDEFYDHPCEFELRKQAVVNRQSSTDALDDEVIDKYAPRIYQLDKEVRKLYHDMLEDDVAQECARNILPLYTPTRVHMSGTIRSYIHYVGLRGGEDTQFEHRVIAQQLGMILALQVPDIIDALMEVEDHSLLGWQFLKESPD